MENILGIIGTITGILGLSLAVFVIIRQAKIEKMHTQGLGIHAQEKARIERLMFLTDRIFDPYIPKEFKLPFYKEYISMKGNGTAVRFWQLEGERERREVTAKPC